MKLLFKKELKNGQILEMLQWQYYKDTTQNEYLNDSVFIGKNWKGGLRYFTQLILF